MTSTTTRLVSLAALTMAALAPLAAYDGSPAAAATGSCDGLSATVSGMPGQTVTGTNGPDVIVTGGADRVNALGGDDVICVSGLADKSTNVITIIAGSGNDTVDTTQSPVRTSTDLGLGDDTFTGGGQSDDVKAEGDGTDTISTAGGADSVVTGNGDDPANADSINLGAGDDSLSVTGGVSSAPFTGGTGTDSMDLSGGNGAGNWIVDNATGTATRAGGTVATWSSFESFDLSGVRATNLTFSGSAADEKVVVGEKYRLAGTIYLDPAAGDDTIVLDGIDDYKIVGGPGINTLVAYDDDHGNNFRADLQQGKIYYPGKVGTETGIRDVTAYNFDTTKLLGNKLANRLVAHGAYDKVRLVGRDGNDYMSVDYSRDSRMNGGNGNDTMYGGRYNDTLIGGAGSDKANGGQGTDSCSQDEVKISCEKG